MMVRTGQVKNITSRDFQSVKLWSFQLEDSDRYFRTGKVEPPMQVGDIIRFEEKNGIVDPTSIVSSTEEKPTAVYQQEEKQAPMENPLRAVDVGRRMQYQAARSDATKIVIAALQTDHLPHAVNVAKGKRLDLLLGYVEEVTKALLAQEEAA